MGKWEYCYWLLMHSVLIFFRSCVISFGFYLGDVASHFANHSSLISLILLKVSLDLLGYHLHLTLLISTVSLKLVELALLTFSHHLKVFEEKVFLIFAICLLLKEDPLRGPE